MRLRVRQTMVTDHDGTSSFFFSSSSRHDSRCRREGERHWRQLCLRHSLTLVIALLFLPLCVSESKSQDAGDSSCMATACGPDGVCGCVGPPRASTSKQRKKTKLLSMAGYALLQVILFAPPRLSLYSHTLSRTHTVLFSLTCSLSHTHALSLPRPLPLRVPSVPVSLLFFFVLLLSRGVLGVRVEGWEEMCRTVVKWPRLKCWDKLVCHL